jgi:hypothetical protein
MMPFEDFFAGVLMNIAPLGLCPVQWDQRLKGPFFVLKGTHLGKPIPYGHCDLTPLRMRGSDDECITMIHVAAC